MIDLGAALRQQDKHGKEYPLLHLLAELLNVISVGGH